VHERAAAAVSMPTIRSGPVSIAQYGDTCAERCSARPRRRCIASAAAGSGRFALR